MKKIILPILLLQCAVFNIIAQGIQGPAAGKSVVYFVRESPLGLVINFSFFDNDKFIGKFDGAEYMRYECAPGEHLFWSRAENRDFITADLEPGKIYFVEVAPQMGFVKASVKLIPVDPKDAKTVKSMLKLINKKGPVTYPQEELDAENERLQEAISQGRAKYHEELKSGAVFSRLEKNMFYDNF